VWNRSRNCIYAGPNLVYHYIVDHEYLPPDEFIDAVETFDIDGTWDQDFELRMRIGGIYGPGKPNGFKVECVLADIDTNRIASLHIPKLVEIGGTGRVPIPSPR
jgi:hypothetical protein